MVGMQGASSESLDLALWADSVAVAIEKVEDKQVLDELDSERLKQAVAFLAESSTGYRFVKKPTFSGSSSGLKEYLWSLQGVAGANLESQLSPNGLDHTYGEWMKVLKQAGEAVGESQSKKVLNALKCLFWALADAAAAQISTDVEYVAIE